MMKFGIKQKVLLVLIGVLALTTALDALLASYFTNRQNQASAFTALGHDLVTWQDDLQRLTLRLREVASAAAGDQAVLDQLAELLAREFIANQISGATDPTQMARTVAFSKAISLNRLNLVLRSGGFFSIAVYTDGKLSHYVSTAEAAMMVRRKNDGQVLIKAAADANGNLPLLSWPAWDEGKPQPLVEKAGPLPQQPGIAFEFPTPDTMAIDILIPVQGVVQDVIAEGKYWPSERIISAVGIAGAESAESGALDSRPATIAVMVFRKLIDLAYLQEIAKKTGKSPALFSADGRHQQQIMSFRLSAAQLRSLQTSHGKDSPGGSHDTISTSQGSFYVALRPWQFENQSPLILGMASSRESTLENIHETVTAILAAAGVILLLSIALGIFWVQRFIDPIIVLTSAVKGIAFRNRMEDDSGGNRNGTLARLRPVEIEAPDEVGELAQAFNTMTIELRQAFETLEQRVEERTRELASSLAVLNATLDSTADGILAIQLGGGVSSFNTQLRDMWGIPLEMLERGTVDEVIAFVSSQAQDPAQYTARAQRSLAQPEAESFDVIELKDGRTFERYCRPQRIDGKAVGVVVNFRDVSERVRAERELRAAQSELLSTARQAGMAEIATNVLHNVGNVLNSVNVSAGLLSNQVRASKAQGLIKAVRLINEHSADLGDFLTHDEKGKLLPGYLNKLADALGAEQRSLVEELGLLTRSVDHIKQIVTTQQSYAGAASVVAPVRIEDLLEDALRIQADALTRHAVTVVRDFAKVPVLPLDSHRILQILVNLISNAKQAMDSGHGAGHRMTLRVDIAQGAPGTDAMAGPRLRIAVADEGEGIAAENLTQIFNHGFTTRQNGHGFGLHSCALAAREMGGSLTAHSDGPGRGATFTLELPIRGAGGAAP